MSFSRRSLSRSGASSSPAVAIAPSSTAGARASAGRAREGPRQGEEPAGAERPLEGGAAGVDAGLEDLEGLDAHRVDLEAGGEEGPDPSADGDRVGVGPGEHA